MPNNENKPIYRFGEFTLDTAEFTLLRNGERINLEEKHYEVLLMLVENAGRLVKKQDIMDRVWADTFVQESNLPNIVSFLRIKVFGSQNQLIETLSKKGYRFVAPVEDLSKFADEDCPWLGLDSLDDKQQSSLIARENEIEEVLSRLRKDRFVAVIGLSGAGKSSLLHAGIKPNINQSLLKDSAVKVISFRPGQDPLGRLAQEVSRLLGNAKRFDATAVRNRMLNDKLYLKNLFAAGQTRAKESIVWIIDQFEETFIAKDEEKRASVEAFLDNIRHALESENHFFLLAIRGDLTQKILDYPDFWDLTSRHQFPLRPLKKEELRRVILEPAKDIGLGFDDGLIEEILNDVGDERNALPLLSHTLKELFMKREGRELTFTGYRQVGRVREALARYAEEVFREFEPSDQNYVKTILLKLVQVDKAGNDVRRRLPLSDLQVNQDTTTTERLINKLTSKRLLSTSQSKSAEEPVVEISHEALLKHWSKLANWINDNRRFLWVVSAFEDSAKEWIDNNRSSEFLVGDTRLNHVRQTIEKHNLLLKADAQDFYAANLEAQSKRALSKKWAERKILIFTGIALVALFLSVIVLILYLQKQEVSALRTGYAARDALKYDTQLALLLAVKAAEMGGSTTVTDIVRDVVAETNDKTVFLGHSDVVASVAYNGDETRMVTASYDKTVRIWNPETKEVIRVLQGHTDDVTAAVYNPDGTKVASSSKDGTFRVWDAQNGDTLFSQTADDKGVYNIVFSKDGTRLLTAGGDANARLWDAQDGQLKGVFTGHERGLNSAVFSPDDKLVATASGDRKVGIWEVESQKLIRFLEGQDGSILNVAFSPDGKFLATASSDRTVFIWDTEKWTPMLKLVGHTAQVNSAEFSADGRWLVTAGSDPSVKVWSVANGTLLMDLNEHTRSAMYAKFGREGATIYSAGADGTAIEWRLPVAQPVQIYNQHSGKPVYSVEFSPDGRNLLSAGNDGRAVIWNISEGAVKNVLPHPDSVQAAVFSSDGNFIATANRDGKARLWNTETAKLVREFPGNEQMINSVTISSDGGLVAAGGKDKIIIIWNAQTGKEKGRLTGHSKEVTNVAFSKDSSWLISTSADNTIRLWDVESRIEKRKWDAETGQVNSAFFNQDSTSIIAGCSDGTIRILNLSDKTGVTVMRGHSKWVNSAKFNPKQSSFLISASGDNTARLWLLDTRKSFLYLLDYGDTVLNASFSPDGKTIVTSDKSGLVKIFTCGLCGANLPDLVSIAQSRITRDFTPEEKRKYGM